MTQVAIVVVLGLLASLVAWVLRGRDREVPQGGASWNVPQLLDRRDFDRPAAPWLVAVFSSSTCLACQSTWEKAELLASDAVAVQEVDAMERRDLHERYAIDAVPLVLIADEGGVVRRHFLGAPTTAELWAAVAEVRGPG